MKYLSHYIKEEQTALFREMGAFFAFGNTQFDEQRKEGVVYVGIGCGLYCPKDNAKELVKGLDRITEKGIEADKKENGIYNIIKRELANHEAIYGGLDSAIAALASYGVSAEKVKDVCSKLEASGHYADC